MSHDGEQSGSSELNRSRGNWKRIAWIFALLAAADLCFLAVQDHQRKPSRADYWREDLEVLARHFPSVQLDFAKLFTPAKFRQDINELERDVPKLSDSEIVLRLMRIVAEAGVSHTRVEPPAGMFHSYPLEFFWRSDGPEIVQAAPEYKASLGTRIVRIGSMTPEQLEAALAPYLPYDNPGWLHELSEKSMLTREVAAHFGLANAEGSIEITLAKPNGEQFSLHVNPPVTGAELGLISLSDFLGLPPLLMEQNPKLYYWYQYLPDFHALYIQYSRCADEPKRPFKNFTGQLFRFTDRARAARNIERVIVDLRINGGGNSGIIEPLIQGLKLRPQLTAKGGLYALIGRGTYSSGMMTAFEFRASCTRYWLANQREASRTSMVNSRALSSRTQELKFSIPPNSFVLCQILTRQRSNRTSESRVP